MDWLEKASFEMIRRLLEISEQERHHEILLTVRKLRDLSHTPSPYSIPVILRPFSAEIVEGEHFVITDLQHLVSGSSSSARNSKIESTNWELVTSTQPGKPSSTREDSILSPQVMKKNSRGGHPERHPLAKKDSCPAPQESKKSRPVPERRKAPKARVEDFVPWVTPISSLLSVSEEEE